MGGEKKKKEQEKEGKFCTIQIQVRAQQEAWSKCILPWELQITEDSGTSYAFLNTVYKLHPSGSRRKKKLYFKGMHVGY